LSVRLSSAVADTNSFAFSSIRLEILSSNPWIVIDFGIASNRFFGWEDDVVKTTSPQILAKDRAQE
jgi:hypothetical protein